MANTSSLVERKSRLPKFLGRNSWPWWFLATGCFWAGIQSIAAWCKGARVAPLELFDEIGGSDVPMLVWLVLVVLMVWQFILFREGMRRGNWAITKSYIGKSVILFLGAVAFTAVYIEEKWFLDGYWTRMGERHLVDRIGGAAGIAGDCSQLIAKVEHKEIRAINDVVDVKELRAFPALSAWKIERCAVDVEIPRVIFMIDFHEGITVVMQSGKWMVRRERFGGHIYWIDYVELNP